MGMGYNNNFEFVIGDYGTVNTVGTWIETFKITYDTPPNTLTINGNGNVVLSNSLFVSNIYGPTGNINFYTEGTGSHRC